PALETPDSPRDTYLAISITKGEGVVVTLESQKAKHLQVLYQSKLLKEPLRVPELLLETIGQGNRYHTEKIKPVMGIARYGRIDVHLDIEESLT
ncbi:hypothetical protein J0S82_011238, partial [Galemys pyrenaicus]